MEDPQPDSAAKSGPRGAEIVFAVAAFGLALVLLSQAGSQVTWSSGRGFANQPGFWPVMAVTGMVVFGALELFFTWKRRSGANDGPVISELLHWLSAIEFALWFLVYVLAVPQLGYLLSTLIFCTLLTLRLGYRSVKMSAAALVTGFAIVVVFKSFLSVKIPGGAIYEVLPAGLRNFMIINF